MRLRSLPVSAIHLFPQTSLTACRAACAVAAPGSKLLSFSGRHTIYPSVTISPSIEGLNATLTVNSCGKGDFGLTHVTVPNPSHGGPTLMGEVGKIVPHSPMRFSKLQYTATGASVAVTGVENETVTVGFWVAEDGLRLDCHCKFLERGVSVMTAKVDAGAAPSCYLP